MHWNNRIVKFVTKDDVWYDLKEVYYSEDGALLGYASICTGSETISGLAEQVERQHRAVMEAILDPGLVLDAVTFPTYEVGDGDHEVNKRKVLEAIAKVFNVDPDDLDEAKLPPLDQV